MAPEESVMENTKRDFIVEGASIDLFETFLRIDPVCVGHTHLLVQA